MSDRTQRANAIRALSMDAVQKANSGHPGAPMGMADIAEVLWHDHLSHNPKNPQWLNRDRFILSNGHGSMLIYALLHLTGYDVSVGDLKNFRQLHAKTPGHPEYGYTPGVETTTGPLGQGLANAVGMALAEKVLAAQFNRDRFNVIDHFTYAFVGDGCLMEGISHEVCSLAGTLGLGKLIVFYDDNGISIDGDVQGWYTDDTPARFRSYGWQVEEAVDGHDAKAIDIAIESAKSNLQQPTLICCKTTIGKGAPKKQGTSSVHGAPLGDDEIAATRQALNWPHAPFEIPEQILADWDASAAGEKREAAWQALWQSYQEAHPELAAELSLRLGDGFDSDELTVAVDRHIQTLQEEMPKVATRKASQNVLEVIAPVIPSLLGGSADLTGSNLTNWSGSKPINPSQADGNYIYYGVREFGMAAMMNGLALHGGFIPYGGTFLIFMEYARNAVRMAALMKQRCIYVFTHDSIGLGEDGPTHQPIEQLTSLRTTPNVHTWRPCDALETAVAWQQSVLRATGPSALALSRQGLPSVERDAEQVSMVKTGGYIAKEAEAFQAIIIATGSEVALALAAQKQLADEGIAARVVSMPCADTFLEQSADYQESVLPKTVKARLAIEAGYGDYWYRFVGLDGDVLSIDRFGESAPGGELFELFGFTTNNVVSKVKALLNK